MTEFQMFLLIFAVVAASAAWIMARSAAKKFDNFLADQKIEQARTEAERQKAIDEADYPDTIDDFKL